MNNPLCVLIASSLIFSSGAWALDIVKDGKAVARIVTPDSPDDYTKMAAAWIRDYVKKSTGAMSSGGCERPLMRRPPA